VGTYNSTMQVTDMAGAASAQSLLITINPPASAPLVIVTPFLPDGTAGRAYAQTLTAFSGTPPYSWSIVSGFLPSGLRLDASSGLILGTTISSGKFNVVVQVSDSKQATSTRALAIAVAPVPLLLAITTAPSLPDGTVGQTYSFTLPATGGISPYSWSLTSGSLPSGLMPKFCYRSDPGYA
jgi:hypothetical protein